MSRATKRKHVTKEVQEELLCVPKESESIVQIVDSRGNNLHEVMDSAGVHYLVTMPVKFRKIIWVKRGDYVLVEPIAEGDKVKAEIVKPLTKDHIRFYKGQNCWPNKFNEKIPSSSDKTQSKQNENDSTSGEDEDDLFVNTNRNPNQHDNCENKNVSSESSDSD